MRTEIHNLDGNGAKRCHVYDLPVVSVPMTFGYGPHAEVRSTPDYWASVTDVPCPVESCDGLIRWAEAGYVPGYRICNTCGRHFLAKGNSDAPVLIRVGNRRSAKGTYA